MIRHAPPDHAADNSLHLVDGIEVTQIMASHKLVNVPLEMLTADDVVHANDTPFEHRPERIDPLGMDVTADVLTRRVADSFMVGQPEIGAMIVRVDARTEAGMTEDEPLNGLPIRSLNHLRDDGTSDSVPHPDDRSLTGNTATTRSLTAMAITVFATNISFIDFHSFVENSVIFNSKTFTDTMLHEPR